MSFKSLYKNIMSTDKINILDLDVTNDYESDYESECELVDYTSMLKENEVKNKYKNNISSKKSVIQRSLTDYNKLKPMKTILKDMIKRVKTF